MAEELDDRDIVKNRLLKSTAKSEAEIEAEIRAEIQREEDEIEMLRAKAEERRRRQEEEAEREAERRVAIDQENRKREEEERKRKEDLLHKKRQQDLAKLEEEKKKLQQEMTSAGGSKLSNILRAKEVMLMSPEQLEQEKRSTIAERLIKLKLDGQNKDDLIRQAENFYNILVDLHSQIYDLTEKHDRQKYDMMELAERARQIEKGKAKTRKSNIVHTGLGGSGFG